MSNKIFTMAGANFSSRYLGALTSNQTGVRQWTPRLTGGIFAGNYTPSAITHTSGTTHYETIGGSFSGKTTGLPVISYSAGIATFTAVGGDFTSINTGANIIGQGDLPTTAIAGRFEASELDTNIAIKVVAGSSELLDTNIGDQTNETQFSATGVQTMAGDARVMISIDLEPVLATRPSANPPSEGTEDSFATHDFQATNDESVFFHLELPHDYADAGLVHVHFDFFVDVADPCATSVVWGVEYKKLSIGDIFGFTLGGETIGYTQTSVTLGTPANDKKVHQSAEVNLTVTGFVAGDYILLRLFRDANGTGGTDDFPRDARVIDYHIEYLSDKLGEPL